MHVKQSVEFVSLSSLSILPDSVLTMSGKFAPGWVMDLVEKAKQNKKTDISIIESTLRRDNWKDVSAMDRHFG